MNIFNESIQQLLLTISSGDILVLYCILGYFLRKDIFKHFVFVLIFNIALNVALKGSFKVPLPCATHTYAFPSGHMQSSFVFWGFLASRLNKTVIYLLIALLFIMQSIAMVSLGYHNDTDVFAGVLVGFVIITMTEILLKKIKSEMLINLIFTISAGLLMIYALWIWKIPNYLSSQFAAILGFLLMQIALKNIKEIHLLKYKLIAMIIYFPLNALVFFITHKFGIDLIYFYISLGSTLPLTYYFASNLEQNKNI